MKTIIEQISDWIASQNASGAHAIANALEDACTPRPPKPEWFGTGPGQWDAWVVHLTRGEPEWMVMRGISIVGGYLRHYPRPNAGLWAEPFEHVDLCVPVAREGFPSPVGWHVVEGGR